MDEWIVYVLICESFYMKLSLQAVGIIAVQLFNNRTFLGQNPETQGGRVENSFNGDFSAFLKWLLYIVLI